MADGTKIEWTEATWNPITGCSLASPGCTNCYAMQLAGTRLAHIPSRAGLTQPSKAGPVWTGEVRFNEDALTQPLRWKRPRMIFVCAHGDLFHESVPDAWIDRIFAVMALAPQHTFQVLTKRADRMRVYLTTGRHVEMQQQTRSSGLPETKRRLLMGSHVQRGALLPLPNVWLGVSVEDQQRADERIPDLLATPAAVRWISTEPLLGPVDLTSIQAPRYTPEDEEIDWRFSCLDTGDYYFHRSGDHFDGGDGPYRETAIDWVVAGGESGKDARPMHPDWARSLRDQCAAADVSFFFKQWGEWVSVYDRDRDDPEWNNVPKPGDWDRKRWLNFAGGQGFHGDKLNMMRRVGKKRAGRLLDGVLHDGMPGGAA